MRYSIQLQDSGTMFRIRKPACQHRQSVNYSSRAAIHMTDDTEITRAKFIHTEMTRPMQSAETYPQLSIISSLSSTPKDYDVNGLPMRIWPNTPNHKVGELILTAQKSAYINCQIDDHMIHSFNEIRSLDLFNPGPFIHLYANKKDHYAALRHAFDLWKQPASSSDNDYYLPKEKRAAILVELNTMMDDGTYENYTLSHDVRTKFNELAREISQYKNTKVNHHYGPYSTITAISMSQVKGNSTVPNISITIDDKDNVATFFIFLFMAWLVFCAVVLSALC
jgi:hypothetical protein